jgi:hypothetical protein
MIDLRVETREDLAAIRAELGLPPKGAAPVAPPAPVVVAPVVVESSEVPF